MEWNSKQWSPNGPAFVFTEDELFIPYEPNNEVISRLTMNHSGLLQRLVLHPRSSEWVVMYSNPDDPCDSYGQCGVNDICKINKSPICQCLTGFAPKSQEKWKVLDASDGCMRRMSLGCQSGVKFLDFRRVPFA